MFAGESIQVMLSGMMDVRLLRRYKQKSNRRGRFNLLSRGSQLPSTRINLKHQEIIRLLVPNEQKLPRRIKLNPARKRAAALRKLHLFQRAITAINRKNPNTSCPMSGHITIRGI